MWWRAWQMCKVVMVLSCCLQHPISVLDETWRMFFIGREWGRAALCSPRLRWVPYLSGSQRCPGPADPGQFGTALTQIMLTQLENTQLGLGNKYKSPSWRAQGEVSSRASLLQICFALMLLLMWNRKGLFFKFTNKLDFMTSLGSSRHEEGHP